MRCANGNLSRVTCSEHCPSLARKNNTLRMSYRAPEEPRPHLLPEGGVSLKGRPSSDVTKGFENLYERSYY